MGPIFLLLFHTMPDKIDLYILNLINYERKVKLKLCIASITHLQFLPFLKYFLSLIDHKNQIFGL